MAGRSSCRDCRNRQKDCCPEGLLPRRKDRSRLRRRDSVPAGVDRISALPDDLLLEVLVRLRCARAAAHASLLARRWRGLWTRLPELAFHDTAPDELDAALAMAARPSLSVLHIRRPCGHPDPTVNSARFSAWMRAAARLAPARLIVNDVIIRAANPNDRFTEVELPCFDRAASISLEAFGARFVLPPEGHFPALESLSLRSCDVDLAYLLPRCSRLRKLQVFSCNWKLDSLKVHSPTLQELDFDVHLGSMRIRHVDIVAPELKRLRFLSGSSPLVWPRPKEFTLFYSAAMVEELYWRCVCDSETDRFGVRWSLFNLTLRSAKPLGQMHLRRQQHPHVIHTLSLTIGLLFSAYGDEDQDFGQQIFKIIPVTNFQVLELWIGAEGHVYGAMVLHLLGMCTFIRKLRLKLHEERNRCSVKCPCDQPRNWRNLNISLTDLKYLEIHGFNGEGHEVDLLKVVFKSATMLERTDLYFSSLVSPSNNRWMEIYGISKAYPSMKCKFYH